MNIDENKTVNDGLVALIRTIVPLLVGSLFAWAAQAGLGIPAGTSALLELLLVAVFTAAYYAAVRALAARWSWVGWLLGYPLNPTYVSEQRD